MPSLSLFSTLAVKKALDDVILDAFTQETGCGVDATFDPTNVLLDRIRGGARPEAMIGVTAQFDPLGPNGVIDLATRTAIARVGVGIAADPAVPVPAIESVDDLVHALTSARSVTYSASGASGVYFAGLLERLGIAEVVNARATIVEKGFTALAVLDGRADLAVQQLSELLFVPEARLVGPLPSWTQHETEFAVALGPNAGAPARAFATFLLGPVAREAYRFAGLVPV